MWTIRLLHTLSRVRPRIRISTNGNDDWPRTRNMGFPHGSVKMDVNGCGLCVSTARWLVGTDAVTGTRMFDAYTHALSPTNLMARSASNALHLLVSLASVRDVKPVGT